MRNAKTPISREQLKSDLVQQIANEVQEVIGLHSPKHWGDEPCEQVEREVLDKARKALSAMTIEELRSPDTRRKQRQVATTHTRRLLDDRNDVTVTHKILDQLAMNSTLLPEEVVGDIEAGAYPTIEEIALELVVGALDCHATLLKNATAALNERRVARAVLITSFLSALALVQNRK